MIRLGSVLLAASLGIGTAHADAPKVVAAKAEREGNRWMIEVTLQHEDTGWDHFATGFEVQGPDGSRLGYLELTHPNVGTPTVEAELTGLNIPADVTYVLIRTRCSLVGWAAEPVRLDLPAR